MEATYLDQCLKEEKTVRWPDAAMPIKVYVAPFNWYEASKQHESFHYRQMVLEAMKTWSDLANGQVRFRLVNELRESQIDLKWRRVDRKSLGHCEYLVNPQSLLYSAEIQIGISDGRVHAQYNSVDEVRHTILHEFGHALGLVGHSDHPDDIMYVPHQYGVTQVSERDAETLRTLYRLPTAFDYRLAAQQLALPVPFSFHQVLNAMEAHKGSGAASSPQSAPGLWQETLAQLDDQKRDYTPETLHTHHTILSQRGQFLLATQNIQVNPELKKGLLKPFPPDSAQNR